MPEISRFYGIIIKMYFGVEESRSAEKDRSVAVESVYVTPFDIGSRDILKAGQSRSA